MRHSALLTLVLATSCAGTPPTTAPPPSPALPESAATPTAPPAAVPPEAAPSATSAATKSAEAPAPSGAHAAHAGEAWTLAKVAHGAQLLGNLGNVHRRVSTHSSEAQAYFDQGLALTYGFNHDEAARSYAKAAELDPSCAMCFWGAAYTLGPNYNMPLLADRAPAAWEAITQAQAQAAKATAVEQALISALAQRYQGPEYVDPQGMQPYNEAYAAAMRDVARRFSGDLDVQVLYAEAAMNVNPWKLWTPDGQPAPGTEAIVSTLESVLARDPQHVGANHYYIHTIEASKHPEKGLPSARRLGGLVPGAGHLVHMPAHIFQRVGLYADASEANRRAIVADRAYLEKVQPLGYYPMYLGHNYGFLAYSASMLGRSAEALSASRNAAQAMPPDLVCGMPGMDFFLSEPLLVMVRFGRWNELLKEPAPDPKYPVLTALHHHAQGMALAATGRLPEARERLGSLRSISQSLSDEVITGLNQGKLMLDLAAQILEARIAQAAAAPDALELWQAAVELEDRLAYNEPADWFYPTRHYLGALLLDRDRPREAEAVYRADLERNPRNGWALFGLSKALEAQGQTRAAAQVRGEFQQAFAQADITLERTAF